MTGDCRECKDWRGCPGKEWFSYSDIRWCSQQIFWILKYAETLHEGQWPTPDVAVDPSVRGKTVSTEATFAKAIRIIAEVDSRLSRTDWRGRLLAEQCINKETMLDLDYDVREALYYISGRRKDRDFRDWRKDRRYHRKSDKRVVMVST